MAIYDYRIAVAGSLCRGDLLSFGQRRHLNDFVNVWISLERFGELPEHYPMNLGIGRESLQATGNRFARQNIAERHDEQHPKIGNGSSPAAVLDLFRHKTGIERFGDLGRFGSLHRRRKNLQDESGNPETRLETIEKTRFAADTLRETEKFSPDRNLIFHVLHGPMSILHRIALRNAVSRLHALGWEAA